MPLSTSKKLSLSFSLFNAVSLLLLLFSINVIYLFIWYYDQKKEGLYDMNMNYSQYAKHGMDQTNIQNFREYLLTKDVFIDYHNGKTECSDSLNIKINHNIKNVAGKWVYQTNGKIYLIFSNTYKEIGTVHILFDTTTYIHSQIIILQVSVIIIFLFIFLNYFAGKYIVKKSLQNLNIIRDYCHVLDLEKPITPLILQAHKDDEIQIVAQTLNEVLGKIKQQNDALKQFINDTSHELKTPLMAMKSKNNLLQLQYERGQLNQDEMLGFFEYNNYYIQKLNNILEALFLITKIHSQTLSLDLTKVSLCDHIHHLLALREIKNVHIQGDVEIPIDIPTFDIIIENLINNAIKYSDNKDIFISLDNTSLRIADKGKGIREEDIPLLFEKFFKAENESDGMGIGLFIVKRLINLYKWDIEVKSKLGEGSCFIIYFATHEKNTLDGR